MPQPTSAPSRTVAAPARPADEGWIRAENDHEGSRGYRTRSDGTTPGTDLKGGIQGYASATSVNLGESIDFHVTVPDEQEYTIAIHRVGWYGGAGGRHLMTSPSLTGRPPTPPRADPQTGLLECDWPSSWRLTVPEDWVSGLYMAVFTSADRTRTVAPFVVRDDERPARLCVVLPFATYQAYNMWPRNGVDGKSVYYGFRPDPAGGPGREDPQLRAQAVSFDRPFSDYGLPGQAYYDIDAIEWLERSGYDAVYCSNLDLHSGTVDLGRYDAVVFSGHDEYWSAEMRAAVERAAATGTSLAFFSANNCYWHVRFRPSAQGRPDRVLVCYKNEPDPEPGPGGATTKWRNRAPGPGNAEQRLLGVQYRAVVPEPVPLVVQASDHWLWAGCGVSDGDKIDGIVAGEADNYDARYPTPAGSTQTLVAASPFRMANGTDVVHNASVCERPDGTLVFVAGTFHWSLGLNRENFVDARIQRATANLIDRMLQPRRSPGRLIRSRERLMRWLTRGRR